MANRVAFRAPSVHPLPRFEDYFYLSTGPGITLAVVSLGQGISPSGLARQFSFAISGSFREDQDLGTRQEAKARLKASEESQFSLGH